MRFNVVTYQSIASFTDANEIFLEALWTLNLPTLPEVVALIRWAAIVKISMKM